MTDQQPSEHDRCAANVDTALDYITSRYSDAPRTPYDHGGTLDYPPLTTRDTDATP